MTIAKRLKKKLYFLIYFHLSKQFTSYTSYNTFYFQYYTVQDISFTKCSLGVSSRRRRRLGRSRDIVTQVEGSVGVQCLKSTGQGCCSVGCLGSTADWGGVGGGLQLIRQDGLQVGRLKVCPRVLFLLLQDTGRWVGCCQVACHDVVGIQLGLLGLPQHCGGRCRPRGVSCGELWWCLQQGVLRCCWLAGLLQLLRES